MKIHKNPFHKNWRKAMQDHEFDFDPSAWKQMEFILEEEKSKRRVLYLVLCLIGIGMSSIYWFVRSSEPTYQTTNEFAVIQNTESRTKDYSPTPEENSSVQTMTPTLKNSYAPTPMTKAGHSLKAKQLGDHPTGGTAEAFKSDGMDTPQDHLSDATGPASDDNVSIDKTNTDTGSNQQVVPLGVTETVGTKVILAELDEAEEEDLEIFINNRPFSPSWTFGILAGGSISYFKKNLATSSSSTAISSRLNANPVIGGYTKYTFSPLISLQTELHFKPFFLNLADINSKHEKEVVDFLINYDNSGNVDYEIQYISTRVMLFEAPVLLNYKSNRRSSISTGLRFSYLMPLDKKDESDNEETVQHVYSNFDMAFVLAFEYRLSTSLSFDIRYNYGFIDVTKNSVYNKKQLFSDWQLSLRRSF